MSDSPSAPSPRTAATLAVATTAALALGLPAAPADAAEASTNAGTTVTSDRPAAPALVRTGPSRWEGGKLRHPDGGRFDPKVMRWANLVSVVMAEQKIPKRYLPGILAQIQQESSGNPKAVNRWDSNARRGTPSKGLLQVIAPTYRAFAKDGYRNTRYQTVPYTNIYAALKYVRKSYGMGKFRSWNHGANQGY